MSYNGFNKSHIHMNSTQKYTWLIETIRQAGKISLRDICDRWERNKEMSDYKPLTRSTFNRWIAGIFNTFGIIISCQRAGGYLYFIENPEDIDNNRLKKWMLDSFAVSNLVGENLSLKDRILVEDIPSAHKYLSLLIEAMKDNHQIMMTYRGFNMEQEHTFTVAPYCVKLFDSRWYVLAHNDKYNDLRIYGLDRIRKLEIIASKFTLPKDFSASDYFADYYGIVTDKDTNVERIVVRAYGHHIAYLDSRPMHHSQQLLKNYGEYADFTMRLVPTYDFMMGLLQRGDMIEVMSPEWLRNRMKEWISQMADRYKDADERKATP